MNTYASIKSGEMAMPVGDHGLALEAIQIDGGTQSRASLNQTVVGEYAEAIKAGAAFPPIVVFYDGDKHWLADGFHRFHAYQQLGRTKIDADVRQGTRRDAILHSVGANETHGLRRTRDDKRRAVLTLLNDAEWAKWTDREIARQCVVSPDTVGRMRREIQPVTVGSDSEDRRTYTTKHGTVATMKTAGINADRKNAPRPSINDEPSPEAGPQAEASLAGTGTGMPADREGRHEGEAASVDLPTIPAAAPVIGRRDPLNPVLWQVMQLREAWAKANDEARAIFLADITESNPATGTGGDDVDRSAEPASSAVKVGATNSPDEANETRGGLPVAAASGTAEETGRTPAYAIRGRSGTPSVAGVTGGESAATNSSGESRERQNPVTKPDGKPEAPLTGPEGGNAPAGTAAENSEMPANPAASPARQATAAPEVAPPPASGASQFNNPRCLKPETCHLKHSRDCCFDCSVAWAQRPKEEQIRIWAEANEAAA